MLTKFIREGDKVELTPVNVRKTSGEDENKVYSTKVSSIISDESVELFMPMEQTKLILLPVDGEYSVVFYTQAGLYQSFVKVVDRYKNGSLYLLAVDLTSNLRKYQRREFYRFSCALEMCARNLEEDEVQAIEQKAKDWLQPNRPIKRSVIVDISGGGLRFMSNQQYEVGSLIYCSYNLVKGEERKTYEIVGKVLSVRPVDNRPGIFEHRVQYHNIEPAIQEEIIRFIFEEERRSRRRS